MMMSMNSSTGSFLSSSPGNQSSERSKTDQVVLECLYKATEVIVQGRVASPPGSTRDIRHRRARFFLDVEEIEFIRGTLRPWKDDIYMPLTIDVFWDDDKTTDRMLLERWTFAYTPARNDTVSVIAELRQVCKRIGVLLRALFSFVRLTPTHQLFRRVKGTDMSDGLGYSLFESQSGRHLATVGGRFEKIDDTLSFDRAIAVNRFSFVPIDTPFGMLKLSVAYRRECAFYTERTEAIPVSMEKCIIQDYVPSSPASDVAKRPRTNSESLHRLSHRHAQGTESHDHFCGGSRPMNIPHTHHLDGQKEEASEGNAKPHRTFTAPRSVGSAASRFREEVSPSRWANPLGAPFGYSNLPASPLDSDAGSSVDSQRQRPPIPSGPRSFDPKYMRHRPSISERDLVSSGRSSSSMNRERSWSKSGRLDLSTSPQLTPPFSFSTSWSKPSPLSLGMPSFGTSPPFQSNPRQLVSRSPSQTSILSQKSSLKQSLPRSPFVKQDWKKLNAAAEDDDVAALPFSLWGIDNPAPSSSMEEHSDDEDHLPFATSDETSVVPRNTMEESVSLGDLLQQLKNPPQLKVFADREHASWDRPNADEESEQPVAIELYDPELSSFKQIYETLKKRLEDNEMN